MSVKNHMPRIFISYNRVDKDITAELSGYLSSSYDYVWYDTAKLTGGDEWWKEILREIGNCDHFIFLLSKDSLDSEWCKKELDEALRQEKHIIPVRVRDRTEIPINLKDKHCIDMFNKVTVEGLNQIYKAIIRNTKLPTSSENKRQDSDFRLSENLWALISSPVLSKLILGVYNAKVDKDEYVDYFWMYGYQRQKAENAFINPELEKAFGLFDVALERFRNSLAQYKDRHIDRKAYLVLDENHGDKQVAVLQMLEELRHSHKSLVLSIKSFYPEFDFLREETRHQRIRHLVNLRQDLEHHKSEYGKLFEKMPVDQQKHLGIVSVCQHICIEASNFDVECPPGCIEVATEPTADINEFIRMDQKCRNRFLYIAHKRLTPNLVTRNINPLESRIWGEGRERNENALNDAISQIDRIIKEQKPSYSEPIV